MEENIFTPDQVAQKLQVHPFTVLKFIKQGKLKASKLGRVYRIRESDVIRFLDEQAQEPVAKSRKSSTSKETSQVSLPLVGETNEDALKSHDLTKSVNLDKATSKVVDSTSKVEIPSSKTQKSDFERNTDRNVVPKKHPDPEDKMLELDHYILD